jgi:hypothetical protein
MSHSTLLVIAILVAGVPAGHAQVTSDPQSDAPVVYSGTPYGAANCTGDEAVDAQNPGCVPGGDSSYETAAAYPPGYDYVPGYWEAPPPYVGIPDYYWGWPWYGYGWGYGWPYYGYVSFGFGWPYYGYCCYGYSYAWSDHGHHDHGDHGHGDHGHWGGHGGDHGGWDHSGSHGNNGYPGPYRYLGHGQYANQLPGSGSGTPGQVDRSARGAGTVQPQTNDTGLARSGAVPGNGSISTGAPGNSPRAAAVANNPVASQGRFAGRAVLPSASYYTAARAAGDATFASNRTAQDPGYRGRSVGYAYARGYASSAANQDYHVTAMPSRGYASANYTGQTMARSGTNAVPRSYSGRLAPAYSQQAYTSANRAYARGAASSYYAPRAAYAYSGRAAMPSYARGGSYSAPRGGNGAASSPHASVGARSGGGAGGYHGR